MNKEKRSFFERLTGATRIEGDGQMHASAPAQKNLAPQEEWIEEEAAEGELTVDVYQTPDAIVIKTMVAGVRPEDLDINITRDMVTIKGSRQAAREAENEDYFHRELYWGSFSRTILLPEEVDVEGSEANEKYGMLSIRLPKVDKNRQTRLRVKSA